MTVELWDRMAELGTGYDHVIESWCLTPNAILITVDNPVGPPTNYGAVDLQTACELIAIRFTS